MPLPQNLALIPPATHILDAMDGHPKGGLDICQPKLGPLYAGCVVMELSPDRGATSPSLLGFRKQVKTWLSQSHPDKLGLDHLYSVNFGTTIKKIKYEVE